MLYPLYYLHRHTGLLSRLGLNVYTGMSRLFLLLWQLRRHTWIAAQVSESFTIYIYIYYIYLIILERVRLRRRLEHSVRWSLALLAAFVCGHRHFRRMWSRVGSRWRTSMRACSPSVQTLSEERVSWRSIEDYCHQCCARFPPQPHCSLSTSIQRRRSMAPSSVRHLTVSNCSFLLLSSSTWPRAVIRQKTT